MGNQMMTSIKLENNFTCRGGEWFFKNSGSRKILVEFPGSRSLVFYTKCLGVSKHFEVSVSKSKKSKCLGFAFTIRHPYLRSIQNHVTSLAYELGKLFDFGQNTSENIL